MNSNHDASRRKLILTSVACEAPEVGVWLAALSDCRARTLKALVGMRDHEMDWICPVSRNTIGTLLYHIAAIELDWLHSEILEREFPDDFVPGSRMTFVTHRAILQSYQATALNGTRSAFSMSRGTLVGALSVMSLSEFERVRHLQPYDVTPRWVVHHLLQHEAEHRGQIAILRHRFKDSDVPPSSK